MKDDKIMQPKDKMSELRFSKERKMKRNEFESQPKALQLKRIKENMGRNNG